MGLLTKTGRAFTAIPSKAFSVIRSSISKVPLKALPSLALKGGKALVKKSPLGAAVFVGSLAGSAVGAIRKRKADKKQDQILMTPINPGLVASSGGSSLKRAGQAAKDLVSSITPKSKIGKILGSAAAIGGAAFAGEQLLEKLGVRGGAGLIGRRPRKKRKSSRRRARKRSRPSARRVSFTTRDGRRVSFIPRGRKSSLRYTKKIGRRGRGVSKTELRQIRALLRRSERD